MYIPRNFRPMCGVFAFAVDAKVSKSLLQRAKYSKYHVCNNSVEPHGVSGNRKDEAIINLIVSSSPIHEDMKS